MAYHVYVLQNKLNNKIYVGQTNNLDKRRREHKARDRYITKNTPLYAAIKKYGFENFQMTSIEEFETEQETDEAEEFWIQFFQSRKREFGYNLAMGGRVNRGYKWTEKRKQEQSTHKKEYYKTHTPWNLGKAWPQTFKDEMAKQRAGEKGTQAKFTNEQIKHIRQQFLSLKFSINELAKQHKISCSTMSSIVFNKTYIDQNYILSKEFLLNQKTLSDIKSGEHSKKSIKDDKGNVFSSIKEAASFYGIHQNTIIRILQGKRKGRDRKRYWFYYL